MIAIDRARCSGCGECASICPIEGAILNSFGEEANPPGSLTGIPPERMQEVMAEMQAH